MSVCFRCRSLCSTHADEKGSRSFDKMCLRCATGPESSEKLPITCIIADQSCHTDPLCVSVEDLPDHKQQATH